MSVTKQIVSVFYKGIALLGGAIIVVSCGDGAAVPPIEDEANTPTMQVRKFGVTYTEYGRKKMRLTAPLLLRYMMAPEPYSVFPDGFFVEFFTTEETLESQITADYALYKEKPVEIWKAVGNVVVINYEKQQKLFTDTLYWNRQEHTIYTTAPVRIETKDGITNGRKGMTSDEHFTNYEIREIGDSHLYFDDLQHESPADSLPPLENATLPVP
ncbi:MAG: LPS export ABC transporter periplasmic protein LptC [Prevotellaceae bacterium]|jgi:LPS export ABC transporter protein LptC|nr:LPS export ABC transporter periplasmic protein LptC [Prevotellaceae bacterium]